jgi:hypothetical protein
MSSFDGDGASTAPTESEYSGPAGKGKESWYAGSLAGSNGKGRSNNGSSHGGSSLRSNAPPFTSPNISPPPPMGTVHYLPDPSAAPEAQPTNFPQGPPGNAPPGGYAAYPAMYPYFVPYFYPMPYPQPVPQHPSMIPQPGAPASDAGPQNTQQAQKQGQPAMAPTFGPHLPMAIPPQGYPNFVWMPGMPGAPGVYQVPPQQQQPPVAQGQPQATPVAQSAPNNPAPVGQPPHQNQTLFDPQSQTTGHPPHQQSNPPAVQQGQAFTNHNHPPSSTFQHPNAFQGPPPNPNTMSPSRTPTTLRHPGAPPSTAPFNAQNAQQGSGLPPPPQQPNGRVWNGQFQPPNNALPHNGQQMMPPFNGRSGPGPGPERPHGPLDNRSLPNIHLVGEGNRGMPRNAWGNNPYGPGTGVAGMQSSGPSQGPRPVANPGSIPGLMRALPPITHETPSMGTNSSNTGSLRKKNSPNASAILRSPGDETSSVTVRTPAIEVYVFTNVTLVFQLIFFETDVYIYCIFSTPASSSLAREA